MRRILPILFFTLLVSPGFSQVLPVVSDQVDLTSVHVKSLSVAYKHPLRDKSDIVLREDFNESGRIIKKYVLSLWNEVTYTHTTHYEYNVKGLLIEEVSEEKILALFPRDNEYIHDFGNKPLHQKSFHEYNDAGQLHKKSIFIYNTAELDKNGAPSQVVNYTWNGPLISQEKSEAPEEDAFRHTYQIDYVYDAGGSIISKRTALGQDLTMVRTNSYRYDSLGRVDEEIVSDPALPHNNARLNFTYDEMKRVTGKYKLDEMTGEYELIVAYAYDDHGNAISGDRDRIFTYNEKGLVASEQWTDEHSGEVFYFTTTYEYF